MHALYKQKKSLQSSTKCLYGKKRLAKVGKFIFTSTDFDFSRGIFYNVRSPTIETLTLLGRFFRQYKHPPQMQHESWRLL